MSKQDKKDPELLVNILKTAKCQTLTGRSTLTYHIGCTESGELMWQLIGNSGNGYFNITWQKYRQIQGLLQERNKGEAITSDVLIPLYRGRSANSPSFLFAALKQEGLVKVSASKRRCYDRCDDAAFLAGIERLKTAEAAKTRTKAGKNNKAQVVSDAFTQAPVASVPTEKPLFVLTDVPDNKPAKRGRPKKSAAISDTTEASVTAA